MTTRSSPIQALKAQAVKMAAMLKKAERGEPIDVRFAEKIATARQTDALKVGVVMDDKIITLELPWTVIRETSEAELVAYIVDLMQERR